jgi:hypothetical protein
MAYLQLLSGFEITTDLRCDETKLKLYASGITEEYRPRSIGINQPLSDNSPNSGCYCHFDVELVTIILSLF